MSEETIEMLILQGETLLLLLLHRFGETAIGDIF